MKFTLVIDMSHIDDEWTYDVEGVEGLREASAAFKALDVDVIDVIYKDRSLTQKEYEKILGT